MVARSSSLGRRGSRRASLARREPRRPRHGFWRTIVSIIKAEELEHRRFLSASLSNGVLTVGGTGLSDIISVFIDPKDSAKLDVKVRKTTTSFTRANVSKIQIHGFA